MMKLPSSFVLLPFFFFLHSNGQLNSAKVGFTGLDFDLLIFKNPIFRLDYFNLIKKQQNLGVPTNFGHFSKNYVNVKSGEKFVKVCLHYS